MVRKFQDFDDHTPFTEEEMANVFVGRGFFWYFLDNIFARSFDGLDYFSPPAGKRVPFQFSRIHREWAMLAQTNPRFCIQAPRAHLKTTVLGQAHPFWLMAKAEQNSLVDGIYFSYKAELADEKVAELKRLIKSNPYCRFWKDLKPTAESIIDFIVDWGEGPVAEVTLKGSGIKGATRGRHPKFTICDDILSDFANPLASTELRQINRIFRQTIMSLPANPEDVLTLFGTPQAYDDILYSLAKDEDWLWLKYPAVSDWNTQVVQWPEKFDFDRLMKIRKSVGSSAFEVEYQLTPVIMADQFLNHVDLAPSVDPTMAMWDLTQEFANVNKLALYGGFDVGKAVHPSHVTILLEMPNGSLITLYQQFLDHVPYPRQVRTLNHLAQQFKLTRGYYDATYNVLEDRGLDRRWRGKSFTRKLKASVALQLEKRVFAEGEDPGIVLVNDQRFLNQIVQVRKDLSCPETPDGHGDSFWSLALAIQAAEDGPTIMDIGSAHTPTLGNSRDMMLQQLGAR